MLRLGFEVMWWSTAASFKKYLIMVRNAEIHLKYLTFKSALKDSN